jgi:hypothetical protein
VRFLCSCLTHFDFLIIWTRPDGWISLVLVLHRVSYAEFLELMDQSHDTKMVCQQTQQVTDRRVRRSESLLMAASSTVCDDSDDDDDFFEGEKYTSEIQQVRVSLVDRETKEEGELLAASFDKPAVPGNMGAHEYGAMEFFSQRKALSMRGWA